MGEKGMPGWARVGCGCLLLAAAVGLVTVGGLAFFGWRMAQSVTDPEKRRDSAREILGATQLPEGYEPEFALALPMSVQLVVLEGPGRDFVYTRGVIRQASVDRFDRGEIDLRELVEEATRNSRDLLELGSGELEIDSMRVSWMAVRGELDLRHMNGAGGGRVDLGDSLDRVEGVQTVLLLRCPSGGKARLAFWIDDTRLPEAGDAPVDLIGTTGDPDEIRAFLEHFRPCD